MNIYENYQSQTNITNKRDTATTTSHKPKSFFKFILFDFNISRIKFHYLKNILLYTIENISMKNEVFKIYRY